MRLNIHPDYNITDGISIEDGQRLLREYTIPEGMAIETGTVTARDGHEIEICIYRPSSQNNEALPMIMDVHGGGFVAGDYLMDRSRDLHLCEHAHCMIVALNYRLSPQYIFPAALEDCLDVWQWMYDHAQELGANREKMGLFGTSAGANLCAGLAFYIRDHGGPKIALNALNVPLLGIRTSLSRDQMHFGAPTLTDSKDMTFYRAYLGERNGMPISYYAMPNEAPEYSDLPPSFIVAAEYDPLRDDAFYYVRKLMEYDVPVEFHLMPRVGHGFDMVASAPMTGWIREGLAQAFRLAFRKQ